MTPKELAQVITEDVRTNNGLVLDEHKNRDVLALLDRLKDGYGNPIFPNVPRDPGSEAFLNFCVAVKQKYLETYGVDFKIDLNIQQLSDLMASLSRGHGKGGDPSARPEVSPRSQVGRAGRGDIRAGREATVMRRDERLDQL
jgi:hypothetical protein